MISTALALLAALSTAPAVPAVPPRDTGPAVKTVALYGSVDGHWEVYVVSEDRVVRVAPELGDTRTGWRPATALHVTLVTGPHARLTLPAGPVHPATLGLPRIRATAGEILVERVDARTLRFAARGLRFGADRPVDFSARTLGAQVVPP